VFQLPGNATVHVFAALAIYSLYVPLPWSTIIGSYLLANLTVGIWNWYFYNKRLVYVLYLTALHSVVVHLVGIGAAIYLFINGAIILGIISLVGPFGVLALVEPTTYLYNSLAKSEYGMHPKYAFFKKQYDHRFPFEPQSTSPISTIRSCLLIFVLGMGISGYVKFEIWNESSSGLFLDLVWVAGSATALITPSVLIVVPWRTIQFLRQRKYTGAPISVSLLVFAVFSMLFVLAATSLST